MVLIKNEISTPSIILVVDDDRTALMELEVKLQSYGYTVLSATSGKAACEIIEKQHTVIDAILLDRIMPQMDGLAVIEWLKKQKNLTKPAIIMQTGADRPDQIKEGIDAGVFYYLNKLTPPKVLRSVVSSAVKESQQKRVLRAELKGHRASFQLMDRASFQVQTLSEAENVSCFVANCFPNPEVVVPGIAELIVNAIEHGNLSISYEDKTALLLADKWQEEIDHRARLPENISKKVEVDFSKEGNKYTIKISDQGIGFSWQKYMNSDPSRALESHGRGITRANMIFSKLQYNKEGNQVVATIDSTLKPTLDW